MKLINIIFLLLLCHCGVTGQTITDIGSLSDSLKTKLKIIDAYVKQIDKRTDLKKESITSIFLDDTESTHTKYIDSITNQICKAQDEKHTDYYQNGELIYTENRDWDKVNITYFQNHKVLFTTYHLDTENILQIVYSTRTGGRNGRYEYLKLSKDSVIFFAGIPYSKSKYQKHQVNKLKDWNKLTQMLKLSDFDNVKNGKSQLPTNGQDIVIEITTEYHTITQLNGYEDEDAYRKMKHFADLLASIASKHNKKANTN
ncbi:hypothetical protein [Mucilaginibacter pocheonensis]|uniref:Uncharacterized protein n=1 Tax=Mucilaginibacter pocheonensis TaxID=398050 RepID=A0ABU1TBR4_9SPHI|nr:hypothetical protein [Mucilaginibacter pocheonensis]MDR6942828.1 hypothetical protein [Mucilaginibacter pocheonensis]